MTARQIHLFNALYLVTFVVIALLTRAPVRRIAGAIAGGTVTGVVALVMIVVGERAGWWHLSLTWKPWYLLLLWIDFTLGGFAFLLTWRIARRFGARGLIALLVVAAVFGPFRDYGYYERFPEWGGPSPGFAPVLGISLTYILMGITGHGLMRWIAGPAGTDRLTRPLWKPA